MYHSPALASSDATVLAGALAEELALVQGVEQLEQRPPGQTEKLFH